MHNFFLKPNRKFHFTYLGTFPFSRKKSNKKFRKKIKCSQLWPSFPKNCCTILILEVTFPRSEIPGQVVKKAAAEPFFFQLAKRNTSATFVHITKIGYLLLQFALAKRVTFVFPKKVPIFINVRTFLYQKYIGIPMFAYNPIHDSMSYDNFVRFRRRTRLLPTITTYRQSVLKPKLFTAEYIFSM